MSTGSTLRRLALVGSALLFPGCNEPVQPAVSSDLGQGGSLASAAGGWALFFNGANANTSTPLGTVLTTQIDNIAFDAMVKWEGPNAAGSHQIIYYNGHGAVSGWGIIVLGAGDGQPEGTIAILAGGIDIPLTPFRLNPGEWMYVRAERKDGVVEVQLEEEYYHVGSLPVNVVGGTFASIERTTVGGDGTFDAPSGNFHGAIDDVGVRDLDRARWIERWTFNQGSGPTATGTRGTVLHLGNTIWQRRTH
jgi:hypothetical protein